MKNTSLLIVALLITAHAMAQIPSTINFQGALTDPLTGDVVADGDYEITFAIFDAAIDGTNGWSEIQTVVVMNGIFNVKLGAVNPLPPELFSQPLWLDINISGESLTPRVELSSTPYSQAAKSLVGDNFIPNSGNVHIGGSLDVGGVAPAVDLAIDDDDTGLEVPADGILSFYTDGIERMTLRPNGNLGIGTTTPPEKLSISGNVAATDTVKADVFYYNTPKQEYLFIPAPAFMMYQNNPAVSEYLTGFLSRNATGSTAGNLVDIWAPIYLPDKSRIVEIEYYLTDDDATYDHGSVGLYTIDQTGLTTFTSVGSYTGSGGDQTINSGVLDVLVDNSTKGYVLYSFIRQGAIEFHGARITYEISE